MFAGRTVDFYRNAETRCLTGTIMNLQRRYPIGAELQTNGARIFASGASPEESGSVAGGWSWSSRTVPLKQQADGYFAGLVPQAAEGTRYRFRLDDAGCFLTRCRGISRTAHGSSQVWILRFVWNDSGCRAPVSRPGHLRNSHRTFTREGTWQALSGTRGVG